MSAALEIEQIGDHARHAVAARPDTLDDFPLNGGKLTVIEEHRRAHDDAAERVAEVVADDAHEQLVLPEQLQLRVNDLLEVDARALERGRERARVMGGGLRRIGLALGRYCTLFGPEQRAEQRKREPAEIDRRRGLANEHEDGAVFVDVGGRGCEPRRRDIDNFAVVHAGPSARGEQGLP
ncbi:MAG: hypothetical protein ABI445_15320 [Polyangia bacterium]